MDSLQRTVPGNILLAALVYALFSLAAGSLIGGRMIEVSGWMRICAREQAEAIKRKREPAPVAPDRSCGNVLGIWHPDLMKLCQKYGNPDLEFPHEKADRELRQQAHRLREQALNRVASDAGSRCECAAAVYKRTNMIPLAVHAGSARLLTPAGVETMNAGLKQALIEAPCARLSEISQ